MREKTIRQLHGRDFDIVKEGLSESQVAAFVTELVEERDMLVQRQEHLISLTRLAERTVAEADTLAKDIHREAEEEARAQATKILAKAEKDAQELGEQKRAEILAAANKEAQAIKSKAQREVESMIEQHRQRVQEEVKTIVSKLQDQFADGLKGVMEQALELSVAVEDRAAEPEIDNPPSDNKDNNQSPPKDSQPPPSVPLAPEQSEEAAPPTTTKENFEYRSDILEQLQEVWSEAGVNTEPGEPLPVKRSEEGRLPDIEEVPAALNKEPVAANYQGTVELDILPPLTPSQLVEIQKYLRDWPGIGITELRPNKKGYSITIVLDKPVQLIDILKQLPEVADARECNDEDAMLVDLTPGIDGLRRVAVTVCGNK